METMRSLEIRLQEEKKSHKDAKKIQKNTEKGKERKERKRKNGEVPTEQP